MCFGPFTLNYLILYVVLIMYCLSLPSTTSYKHFQNIPFVIIVCFIGLTSWIIAPLEKLMITKSRNSSHFMKPKSSLFSHSISLRSILAISSHLCPIGFSFSDLLTYILCARYVHERTNCAVCQTHRRKLAQQADDEELGAIFQPHDGSVNDKAISV